MLVFFFSTETFAANKLKVGEYYTGVIEEAFSIKNDIPLPPGKWRVNSVNYGAQRNYVSGWLEGPENSWIWFSLPTSEYLGEGKWQVNNSICKGAIAKGGRKMVLGQRNDWCILEHKFDDDPVTYMKAYFQISLKKSIILEYYYPKKYIKNLSIAEYEKFGDMMHNVINDAYKGKGRPLDFLSSIWINNTSSSTLNTNTSSSSNKKDYSSFSDKFICSKATLNDGSGWIQSMQAIDDYVREAWSRSLTIYDCRVLTGRKPLSEVNKVEETSDESSSVKSKLKELKSMLEEGLITQDDFDMKKNELLDQF